MFKSDTEFITVTKIHTVEKYTDNSNIKKTLRYGNYFQTNELVFFISGENETTVDNVLIHDRPGSLRFMPKGQSKAEYTVLSTPPYCCIDVYFDSSVPLSKHAFGMYDMNILCDKFIKLYNIWDKKRYGYYSEAMMIFYDIIHCIQTKNIDYLPSRSRQAVENAYNYILSNYRSYNFDYKKLCDISGLKHSQFNNLFKKFYKITPMELVRKMKINHAKELLITSRYSIAEIANLCGFEDQHYFSLVFKKVTGVPPSRYKQ